MYASYKDHILQDTEFDLDWKETLDVAKPSQSLTQETMEDEINYILLLLWRTAIIICVIRNVTPHYTETRGKRLLIYLICVVSTSLLFLALNPCHRWLSKPLKKMVSVIFFFKLIYIISHKFRISLAFVFVIFSDLLNKHACLHYFEKDFCFKSDNFGPIDSSIMWRLLKVLFEPRLGFH